MVPKGEALTMVPFATGKPIVMGGKHTIELGYGLVASVNKRFTFQSPRIGTLGIVAILTGRKTLGVFGVWHYDGVELRLTAGIGLTMAGYRR